MPSFNLADLFELVNDAASDREAIVAGERRLTYAQLEERVNRLANRLAEHGIGRGDHVGLQLANGTEYVEGMLAAFKLRAVPINVNYRYVADELRYLFDDADLKALIVHRRFCPTVASIATDLPKLELILVVEDGSGAEPLGAPYEEALASAPSDRPRIERSADDIYCAYTGGTTGMPKGVMWRHEDIFFAALGGGDIMHSGNFIKTPEELVERLPDPGLVSLATPPFMHVSAHWLVLTALFGGGKMVVTEQGRFEPDLIWDLVERERVNMLIIVGDAMARPLADALAQRLDRTDTSSLIVVGSGGAVLSATTKDQLAQLLPSTMIVDGFGSSETGTLGTQATSSAASASGPRFNVNEQTAVFDDDLKPVEPGSGVVGRLARRGHIPLLYHKDPEKTAKTFVEIDGVRWVLPGDFATVESDGTIALLGRGSGSINTGGEKVYPEEVEAALKADPDVFDALVVGVPDDRWGEKVVALVKAREGAAPSIDTIQATCRDRIAGYKVPRELLVVDEIVRTPAGKPDYKWAKEHALSALTT